MGYGIISSEGGYMRLRNVKKAKERLEVSEHVIKEPFLYRGKWQEFFKNKNPIHVEIGVGKGAFITTLAKNNSNINYVGIEKYDSVLVKALDKIENLANLKLLRVDANIIDEIFASGEISLIYLNFSDPWPKKRHVKRRLTSPVFLEKYIKILKSDGEIHLKTDNEKFFEYSLKSLSKYFYFKKVSLDLYSEDLKDNIMTEYEDKFVKMEKKIYKLEACLKKTF